MRVIPLEDTRIVNNLPGSFDRGTIGAIALNDSTNRILGEENMIAVGDLTPIGAASQVGNTDGLEIESFDFIIPQAIVE